MASNNASTMGVSGVGEGLAATKLCAMLAIVEEFKPCKKDSRMSSMLIVEESKPCKKDSRMSSLLIPNVNVVRVWFVGGGGEMAVLMAELG